MEKPSVNIPENDQKKIHPKESANFFKTVFFLWALPLFVKGYKKDLREEDLYGPLQSHKSVLLGDKLEKAWSMEINTKCHPSFARALIKVFGVEFAKLGIFFFIIEFIVKMIQPLFVGKLMEYYQPDQNSVGLKEAYMYASLIVLMSLINVLIGHNYILALQHLGMKIRVAVCSLIYRKALRLSKAALIDTTIGQMVNLLSNDVNRFEMCTIHLHNMWAAPLQTAIVSYLLYINLGWPALTGIIVLVTFIPLQMYLGKLMSVFRLKTALKTDQRVRLMNEIICGIQVIKMYTWEKPFAKLVHHTRKLEIRQIRNSSYIRACNSSFTIFLNRLAICICVITYVLTGNILQSTYVYIVSSFYGLLRQALTMFLPQGFTAIAEAKVSIKRIKKFLLYDEIENNELKKYLEKPKNGINGKVPLLRSNSINNGITLKEVSVKWSPQSPDNTLNKIDFNVSAHQLVAVVGPVGSGKTTLLHVILKELPLVNGTLEVGGTISYASQEPWLFGGSIRQNILFGQIYDEKRYRQVVKVCALRRDFSLFPYGDRTIVGERGTMLSGGQKARINLARAVYKEADIYLLDDPLSAVDTHVGKQLFDECISGFLQDKCVVLVTHQLQYLRTVSQIYLFENGAVVDNGTFSSVKHSNNDFLKRLESQSAEDIEEEKRRESFLEKINSAKSLDKLNDEPVMIKEQQGTGTISKTVYASYFRAGGHICISFLIGFIFVITQMGASCNDYFLNYWVNLEQKRVEEQLEIQSLLNDTDYTRNGTYYDDFQTMFFTSENCMYIYCGLVSFVIFSTLTRSLSFFKFCATASKRLHNNMFSKIVYNSMYFFNTNPSGRILNRFSKDIGAIDENLPIAILDTVQIGLIALGINIVIASINPWIIIPSVVIFTLFYFLRRIFLATSRNLKRIEGTTRSPVFTHMSASIQGLTTIRAFGAQEILKMEFDNHQDAHSAAFYMFLGSNRTFGFWLDLNCCIYIAIVTLSFLLIGTEKYGGNVGLGITQSITLTGMLQWGMRQWSELENQMTSVERVVEYTQLETESHRNKRKPTKDWPTMGAIEFRNVSMEYGPDEPLVLKRLSFKIEPKEKIGIVGRTGAGKSSLISALFRLANVHGEIIIDGIDTETISLHSLRSKLSIIPQEPVLFSGTLRKNLDPFDEYEDPELWGALEEVELKSAISELPLGLECNVSEGGSNFSVGQRQLLCLARAAIRSNKILVLDEATANVDPQTDELIQRTIRKKFADCTVLTIAHRLHTVMDSDRILVMDAGQAAEFDHPFNLLENKESIFYGLVKQTGKAMSENLIKIAEKNYQKRNETHN